MTSRACFFNTMREDLRHKIWMIVLSVLGNILAMPVLYLLISGGELDPDRVNYLTRQIYHFITENFMISAGIIAIGGALIVGLASFRYLFHRNMVDTYHSMPVKRGTLFLASWLNSLLIWFVPFCAGYLIMLGMGIARLTKLRQLLLIQTSPDNITLLQTWTVGNMVKESLLSVLVLIVAFAVIYHLILLAVMFSGNILNTLVVAGVLGAGIESLILLVFGYCTLFFRTFASGAHTWCMDYMFLSPIINVGRMFYDRAQSEAGWSMVQNIILAVIMLAVAYLTYLRRPSELSEQGLKNKPLRMFIQILCGLSASMGGWIVMYGVSESLDSSNLSQVWGIFGAILVGVLTFGVLNCVFYVDIKAFLKNKLVMGVTTAAGIVVSLVMCGDLIGYDSYLPGESDIAEISLYGGNPVSVFRRYGGTGGLLSETHPINRVAISDAEMAYELLQRGVEKERENGEDENTYTAMYEYADGYYQTYSFTVKVTLKNGRVYYRNYRYGQKDADVIYALVSKPEYMRVNYQLPQEDISKIEEVSFRRQGPSDRTNDRTIYGASLEESRDFVQALITAYNRDLEEHTESVIKSQGRVLCQIRIRAAQVTDYDVIYLTIVENMTYTRDVLRKYGYSQFADFEDADAIKEIRLEYPDILYCPEDPKDLEEYRNYIIQRARMYYGLPYEENTEIDYGEVYIDAEACYEEEYIKKYDINTEKVLRDLAVIIDTPAEIEEIMELVSYHQPDTNFFAGNYNALTNLVLEDGTMYEVLIPDGALPEKYVLRFGELVDFE